MGKGQQIAELAFRYVLTQIEEIVDIDTFATLAGAPFEEDDTHERMECWKCLEAFAKAGLQAMDKLNPEAISIEDLGL